MKALICTLALTSIAMAEPPVKKPLGDYSTLWTNSFFTSKPPPPVGNGADDPTFSDWSLGGVSPIGNGYRITLFNRKKPEQVMTISHDRAISNDGTDMQSSEPGKNGTFSVTKVEYGQKSWKDTKVTIASGGKVGIVGFDEKSIVPKASAAPNANRQGQQQQPGQNGVQVNVPQPGSPPNVAPVNGATNNNTVTPRVPRPRVIPPTNNR